VRHLAQDPFLRTMTERAVDNLLELAEFGEYAWEQIYKNGVGGNAQEQ
jgi:hypothetical protein